MNPRGVDYYAVLQVHPEAEQEVIEAAYRRLMRKYHPDVGGTDPESVARSHERAKAINQAYSVLRDPIQRRIYDEMRRNGQHAPRPRPTPQPSSVEATWHAASQPAETEPTSAVAEVAEPKWWSAVRAPGVWLASAYFLLPGAYEWEPASRREVLRAFAIPPLGIASWLLLSGRLEAWVGASLYAVTGAWAVLGIVAVLTLGQALPRLAIAGGATLLLVSGTLDASLRSAGVPSWLDWVGLSLLNLLIAAREYVFGVLPTVGICWLLARLG